jgi:hypothetical protein
LLLLLLKPLRLMALFGVFNLHTHGRCLTHGVLFIFDSPDVACVLSPYHLAGVLSGSVIFVTALNQVYNTRAR